MIVIVTGRKQSQLLDFWTWLGLEFDKYAQNGLIHPEKQYLFILLYGGSPLREITLSSTVFRLES